MKKQIKKAFLAIALIYASTVNSQVEKIQPCDTYAAMEEYFSNNPEAKLKYDATQAEFQKNFDATIANKHLNKVAAFQYTIPVVFHILHMNGTENVSDAVVNSALAQVNADFAASNSDYSSVFAPFKALYINSDIKFVLARKDPNGNCTSGIIHRYDTRTVWDRNPPSSGGNPALYSGITWTSTTQKYLNVIVVKDIVAAPAQQGQVIGYTWLPGTWATNAIQDAIVYNNTHLAGLQARSLTHEIGHWLNLTHTFGSTNNPGVTCGSSSGGDGVADTPDTKGNFSTCPASSTNTLFTCLSPNPSNANDYYQNVENFMDYSSCAKNFTSDQTTRMRNALQSSTSGRNQLWTTNNLNLTDVNNAISCAPTSEFQSLSNSYTVCAGASLGFKDYSYNGTISTYSWSGDNGVIFSSSGTSTTSAVFPQIGTTNVTLTVSNAQGSGVSTKQITVIDSKPGAVGTFTESFEAGLPSDWAVINNDAGSSEWEHSNTAYYHGDACFFINGSNCGSKQEDFLEMPVIDALNSPNKVFAFAYAYAQQSSTQNDELRVQGSLDCGGTWTDIVVLSGSQMQSNSGGVTATPYNPSDISEWKTYTVSNHPKWSTYKNSIGVKVRFNFVEGTAGNGNNLFIDAIGFGSGPGYVGLNELSKSYKFSVYPNPTNGEATVNFNLSDAANVKVTVIDVLGREVETLLNGNVTTGDQTISVNKNNHLPSGIYFVNLNINGAKMISKLIVE